MQTVIETSEFLRRAKECGVTEEERAEIVDFIAANPMAGNDCVRSVDRLHFCTTDRHTGTPAAEDYRLKWAISSTSSRLP